MNFRFCAFVKLSVVLSHSIINDKSDKLLLSYKRTYLMARVNSYWFYDSDTTFSQKFLSSLFFLMSYQIMSLGTGL